MTRIAVDHPGAFVVRPDGDFQTGVLVLAGSSGRVDRERALLLARHGALAASIRWFGGPGQPSGISEIPLETFGLALDRLARDCDRLALVGVSKGAEAALLWAAHDARVAVVAGFAAPHVVWAGVGPGPDGERSSWTLGGEPLPFVPYDENWRPETGPPAYRGLYDASLRRYPDRIGPAELPVERIAGEVILAAGGDDRVWASLDFARAIAGRRAASGLPTEVHTHPDAGHRLRLPGEPEPGPDSAMARGGDPGADAALGAMVWPSLVRALGLSEAPASQESAREQSAREQSAREQSAR